MRSKRMGARRLAVAVFTLLMLCIAPSISFADSTEQDVVTPTPGIQDVDGTAQARVGKEEENASIDVERDADENRVEVAAEKTESLPKEVEQSDGADGRDALSGDAQKQNENDVLAAQDEKKQSIASAAIDPISNQAYTGSPVTPEPVVKLNGQQLKKETDYTVSYQNNQNAGTAIVKVQGIGAYEGEKEAQFQIVAPKVSYRVHVQTYGDQQEVSDGEVAGTSGESKRLEGAWMSLSGAEGGIEYRTHVQREGWQGWVADGAAAGTEGRSLRLEGLEARLSGGSAAGGVEYRTHVQGDGWQDWVADGAMAGTEGRSLRLEAACVRLAGEASELFDVWYRVHAQTYGWLGWASNGDPAGTEGLSRRLEAIEVRLTAKGSGAPGSTDGAFIEAGPIYSGDAELDSIVEQIINNHTDRDSDALRNAFDYIVSYPYIDGEAAITGDWTTWSIPKAKQMYYRPGGNCYHYGSLMAWVARGLGYDARAVSGEIQGGVLGWSYHGWCEVTVDGTKYVIDPDLQKFIPNRNFFMVTYDQAPTFYRGY